MTKPAVSWWSMCIRHDPDLPNNASPLDRPESRVKTARLIVSINGESAASVPDERALLRGKAGTQVLLRVRSSGGETRDVLVIPIKAADEANLRYSEWEYTRRLKVDAESGETNRLCPFARHGTRGHRPVGARILSDLQAPGPHHRRSPQSRRQH